MRTILNVPKITVLSTIGLTIAVAVAIFGYRAYLQHQNAQLLAIRNPNGIDEGIYVEVGGIEQWVQIRGQDRNNPVILCLHGGPGASWLPLTPLFMQWERRFTVVQWDQRGAGKTVETTGDAVAETMSVDRMAQDGLEVSEFLRNHLHKKKLILLGHSWGSILGIRMVKKRPDLFSAYIGTGQVSNVRRSLQLANDEAFRKARAADDSRAVRELQRIGPPPYDGPENLLALFHWLGSYGGESDRIAVSSLGGLMFGAPNYSLWDIYNRARGFTRVPTWRLYREILSTDLSRLGPNFNVPIYFFQGADDEITLTAVTREYFDSIVGPHKEFVLLEGAGHFAVWSMHDRFLQELEARLSGGKSAGRGGLHFWPPEMSRSSLGIRRSHAGKPRAGTRRTRVPRNPRSSAGRTSSSPDCIRQRAAHNVRCPDVGRDVHLRRAEVEQQIGKRQRREAAIHASVSLGLPALSISWPSRRPASSTKRTPATKVSRAVQDQLRCTAAGTSPRESTGRRWQSA